jgi:hypothetical protein
MLLPPAGPRTVTGSLASAAVFTALSSAVAAAVHHATADSPVSEPSLALAAAVMFLCAVPAFQLAPPRVAAAVAVAVHAALPTWLNATETPPP